jgi:hypothetical protein
VSTLDVTIRVPDFFPAEWINTEAGDSEHGTLILIESRRRFLRRAFRNALHIPFTVPGGFPRRPNEARTVVIRHRFEERIVPTEWYVDGPEPWTMRRLDAPAFDLGAADFWAGDRLVLTLTLRAA